MEEMIKKCFDAVINDNLQEFECLISEQGLSLECQHENGSTPIVAAAYYGSIKCLKFLHRNKVNIEARGRLNHSAS